MDWREWFGFSRPRDAPERELPKIEDNVRDSGGIFVFGQTLSGERVDEKSAMQIATVYACVRLLAETVASLPLHLYKFTEKGDGKEKATEHPLYKILYRQANPEMTSFSFREAMMTHLLLWGNAYAQIVRDGKNGILGLYPLLPENVEIDRAENGELFYTYHAYTDEVPGEHDKDMLQRSGWLQPHRHDEECPRHHAGGGEIWQLVFQERRSTGRCAGASGCAEGPAEDPG